MGAIIEMVHWCYHYIELFDSLLLLINRTKVIERFPVNNIEYHKYSITNCLYIIDCDHGKENPNHLRVPLR